MFRSRWLLIPIVIVLAVGAWLALRDRVHAPTTTVSSPGCVLTLSPGSSREEKLNMCPKILVFSKTAAYRHASIQNGIAAIRELADEHHVIVDFTEDAAMFTDANLQQYAAVVFLSTTGEVLDADQEQAFERYIRAGHGYVGIHSASDTGYEWPWYGRLVGAYFDRVHGHSHIVQATLDVMDRTHPSTSMLPTRWIRTDEWYNFATNPSDHVHVLMTIDETTYKGGVMGANHPIAWYHSYDGGRAWYTALGHTPESYSEPLFLTHLWGGIEYAIGQ